MPYGPVVIATKTVAAVMPVIAIVKIRKIVFLLVAMTRKRAAAAFVPLIAAN